MESYPQSYSKAQSFYKKHGGFLGLVKFIKSCNPEPRPGRKITKPDLGKIGREIQNPVTASQICRDRIDLMEPTWRPRIGTLKFLEHIIEHFEEENQGRKDLVEEIKEARKEAELQLIMGKAMGFLKNGPDNKRA
jgi:phosphomannomutase